MMNPDLKIGSVVVDCIKFDEMLAFWREASTTLRESQPEAAGLYFEIPRAGT